MSRTSRLDALLRPQSVALIGASTDPAKIGGRPVAFTKRGGFEGRFYPINPNQARVQDLPAFPSIREVPEAVDFAIIALPAARVPDAVEEVITCKARSIAIFSSGFAELGAEGVRVQQAIAARCRGAGIPLLGPNSLGYFAPVLGFYPTFSTVLDQTWPAAGDIGLASQSGAFSTYFYGMAADRGLGFSHVIATGNEADVDVAECLEWLAEDDNTRVIVACLEGCRDGTRLREAFERAAMREKPVIIMKVGASEAGAAAVSSHTGSLAGSDRVYDAVFREHGVYRACSLNELINVSYACARGGRLPGGRRLGILTTSGGLGVLMADEASRRGIELPPMTPDAVREIKNAIPFASAGNPIDATAQIVNDFDAFQRIVDAMMSGAAFDGIVVFLQRLGRSPRYAAMLAPVLLEMRRRHPHVMTILCMGAGDEFRKSMEEANILIYEDPVDAVVAFDAASRLGANRPRNSREWRPASGSSTKSDNILLAEDESKRRLEPAGIPFVEERKAATKTEAIVAATNIGFPVAMKVLSAGIAHKSDVGGVLLDLRTEEDVAAAWDAITTSVRAAAPCASIEGVLVSRMVSGGVELVIGAHRDPVFGMMTMVGLGGQYVEIFDDVALRSAPVSRVEAASMLVELKAVSLLRGARGRRGVDMERLIETIVALSNYAVAAGDIVSVEINPYIALPDGGVAVDALIVATGRA